MSLELELLSALYTMYKDGELNNEFDKTKNKMVTSSQLDAIMKDVKSVLPAELSPLESAKRMRELPEEKVDEAIEASNGKVVDMRKMFQRKMSENRGAIGLTQQLVEAIDNGDLEEQERITGLMKELYDTINAKVEKPSEE